jgi:N-acetylmuramoyl-L-alanine amidase
MSSINYWRNLDNGVCAHFVIERDGTIIQCRPCNRTAGHAGASKWSHSGSIYYGLNSCSIGIELANGGDSYPQKFSKLKPTVAKHKHGGPMTEWETYPPEQIEACHRLAAVLCDRYKLDAIVGHDDISPGRKTDPGPAADEFMATMRKDCGFPG